MVAAAIAAIRKRNANNAADENVESEPLMDNLVETLPPKESWDAEYVLGTLLVG